MNRKLIRIRNNRNINWVDTVIVNRFCMNMMTGTRIKGGHASRVIRGYTRVSIFGVVMGGDVFIENSPVQHLRCVPIALIGAMTTNPCYRKIQTISSFTRNSWKLSISSVNGIHSLFGVPSFTTFNVQRIR